MSPITMVFGTQTDLGHPGALATCGQFLEPFCAWPSWTSCRIASWWQESHRQPVGIAATATAKSRNPRFFRIILPISRRSIWSRRSIVFEQTHLLYWLNSNFCLNPQFLRLYHGYKLVKSVSYGCLFHQIW